MTAVKVSPDIIPTLPTPEVGLSDREVLLQTVLSPADYQYAKDTGLDKLFYYDEETGRDGLRHILTGEVTGERRIPQGFHHNTGTTTSIPGPDGKPLTRVEQIVDEDGRPTEAKPMSPYHALVVVDGKEKRIRRFDKDKKPYFERAANSMFPDEYDAFLVMRTVQQAVNNTDPSQDVIRKMGDKWYYNLVGKAVMIDGKSEMALKIVMDYETTSVITAYPFMQQTEQMNLTPAQAEHHATYGLSQPAGSIALGAKGVHHV